MSLLPNNKPLERLRKFERTSRVHLMCAIAVNVYIPVQHCGSADTVVGGYKCDIYLYMQRAIVTVSRETNVRRLCKDGIFLIANRRVRDIGHAIAECQVSCA